MTTRPFLEEAAEGLAALAWRNMFGHETVFRGRQIFALATTDRVGVRLPDPALYAEAMALPGSDVFDPTGGGKGMAHWVLLPADIVDEPRALRAWVARAHALAGTDAR